ncbi:hypothetical protein [Tropicimonas sp. S265A]|uniref:hypothetical protein n=1 Tax=Tropicimonas sp. S265A TaxID=3415134 RepID=UPI003C7D62C5
MKRLLLVTCLTAYCATVPSQGQAVDLRLSQVLEWKDHIGEVLKDLDDKPTPPQRREQDWNAPPTLGQQRALPWQSDEDGMLPWVRMDGNGVGAGLLLEF